ncbi:hypothetical protein V8E55_008090, partial [Tylopilus felleus]
SCRGCAPELSTSVVTKFISSFSMQYLKSDHSISIQGPGFGIENFKIHPFVIPS